MIENLKIISIVNQGGVGDITAINLGTALAAIDKSISWWT